MARGDPGEDTYQPRIMPEDLPRKVVPEMSGQNFGGAISQIGDTLEKKYQADSATWASDQLTQLRVQATQSLQAAKDKVPAGQDPGNFSQDYLKSFDNLTKPITDNDQVASNPTARGMLSRGITDLKNTLAEHTMQWEAQQRVAYRADSLQNNLAAQLPVVQAHPELADQVGSTLADQVRALGVEPSKQYPILKAMHTQLSGAAADGMVHNDPQGMLDALKNPENAPANLKSVLSGVSDQKREELLGKAQKGVSSAYSDNVVSTYRSQGPMAGAQALAAVDKTNQPEEIKAQIRSDIEKGVNQWHEEQRQKFAPQIMGLEERLGSGKTSPDDRNLAISLWRNGAYTAAQAGESAGRVDKAQEKQVDDTANFNTAHAAYTNGQGLDPKDKDSRAGVAQLFDAYTKGIPPGSAEWINRAADISQKTGVTPDSVVEWSRTALVSGNPQYGAQAATTIQRMQDANPRGVGFALDPETKAMAKSINDAVHAGTDPATAVENARKISSMPDADKLRLEELYKSNNSQFAKNTIGALTNELKSDTRLNTPSWLPFKNKVLDIPNGMAGEYEQLRQNYFKLTNGNIQQANDLAFADLKNTWGITKANGKAEYMQFAPEQMNPGLTTENLRKDMEASATGLTPDPSKVHLIPTADTFQSGGQRWAIGVPDKFGAYSTLNDKRGNPIPYQLPTAAASFQETKSKLAAEGMAKLHLAQQQSKEEQADALKAIEEGARTGSL